MFEVQTYNIILNRLLKRLPENEDKRPSSPLYILSGPAAKELETVYGELDYTLDQAFPTTAGREYLIKDAKTYNMAPYPATHAVVEGEFDLPIELGTRFTKDGIGFRVTAEITKASIEYYYYELTCDDTGEIGNVLSGVLVPDWNIPGLKHAYVTKLLVPGESAEDTETFRQRYLASFNSKSYGGNLADYIERVSAIDGVGKVKVLRCIDRNGEKNPEWVTVVFTTSEFKAPTEELVNIVQYELQPLNDEGEPDIDTSGLGIAPIGHLVNVEGAEEEPINIELSLIYQEGYSWLILANTIREKIAEYFAELSEDWGDTYVTENAKNPMGSGLTVMRSRIESLLIDIEGILDANETKIMGEYANYYLDWNRIPVLGEVTQSTVSREVKTVKCNFNCPDCTYDQNALICPRVNNG